MTDDQAGGTAAHASPIAPGQLEMYFDSIQGAFQETRAAESRSRPWLLTASVAFSLSLVPLIPYLLSRAASHFVLRGELPGSYLRIPIASFWSWWVASVLSSLMVLVLVARMGRPSKQEKQRWLTNSQMRFGLCYATALDVQRYRASHLPIYIDSAVLSWRALRRALLRGWPLGTLPSIDLEFLSEVSPLGRVLLLESGYADRPRPRWYKVDPETDLILRGFGRFYSLGDRLRDRRDLAIVEKGLMDLAAYLYTEIPEVADDVPDAQDSGTASLKSFAEHMSTLPAYVPERAVAETGRLRHGLAVAAGRVNALFCHPNALVSFAAWYALMLALFLAGFWVALRFLPAVRVDSTVVTAIVGGPVATAITAVTVPRLVSARKSGQ